MNEIVIKAALFALLMFLAGIFIAIASKNIIKIFIGLEISFNASILMLSVWQNPNLQSACAILSVCALILGFCAIFIILNIYKKFRTLNIDEIQQKASEGE